MDPNIIITEIKQYAEATGLKPTTICQMALGNPRYFDRLSERTGRLLDEAQRLRDFMAANPPQPKAS